MWARALRRTDMDVLHVGVDVGAGDAEIGVFYISFIVSVQHIGYLWTSEPPCTVLERIKSRQGGIKSFPLGITYINADNSPVHVTVLLRALTNAFYFSEKSDRFLGNFLDLTRTKTLGFLTQFVKY